MPHKSIDITFRPCCGSLWEEGHKQNCSRYCQVCRGDLDSCEHGLQEDLQPEWFPRALQFSTLRAVQAEAIRAHKKHKTNSMLEGRLDGGECLKILVEEVGEVARAMTYDEGDPENLKEELVQVAAMASSWYDFLTRAL